jgi:hypothetical protein
MDIAEIVTEDNTSYLLEKHDGIDLPRDKRLSSAAIHGCFPNESDHVAYKRQKFYCETSKILTKKYRRSFRAITIKLINKIKFLCIRCFSQSMTFYNLKNTIF